MKKTTITAAVLALALTACGGDDEDAAAEATPTPTPVATTAPPTEAPPASQAPQSAPPASQAPHAEPTAGKETPQEAAQAFWADWADRDRVSASAYATRAAIDEAFAQSRPQAEFVDCIEEGNRFLCGYYYEGGGVTIYVVDSDAYGHIVTDVSYVAD